MLKSQKKSKKNPKTEEVAQVNTPPLTKKELKAQKKKADRARKEAISAIATYGGLALLVGIGLFFVAEPKIAIAGGGGIAVLALCFKYPRQGLWAFMIYMPFSGTITYWIGGGNAIFQLAKDGFFIPAAIALALICNKKKLPLFIPKEWKPSFSILVGVVLLTLLFVNGSLQMDPPSGDKPFLQGILGLKVLLGYVPLIPCAYYLIRHKQDLLFCGRLHAVLAIICCTLGLIQYQMLSMGMCHGTRGLVGDDLFKATLDAKCLVGGSLVFSPEVGMVRLPGTFVAPWQWAWFLISNAVFSFAPAFNETSRVWRIIGLLSMALVFVNAVISGQRIALALVPTLTVILLVLTGQVANLKRFVPIAVGLGLVLVIGAAANPDMVEERLDSFVSRWNASPPQAFIVNQFHESDKELKGSFLGKGVGKATNSTRVFGNARLIETYYPKLLYELGYPGMLAFLAAVLHLTFIAFKSYRSVKDKNLRGYGASFWVFILFISVNTYYYPLDVDPVAVYYWFLAGIIFKLPDIERQEEEKKLAAELTPEEVKKRQRKIKHLFVEPI